MPRDAHAILQRLRAIVEIARRNTHSEALHGFRHLVLTEEQVAELNAAAFEACLEHREPTTPDLIASVGFAVEYLTRKASDRCFDPRPVAGRMMSCRERYSFDSPVGLCVACSAGASVRSALEALQTLDYTERQRAALASLEACGVNK